MRYCKKEIQPRVASVGKLGTGYTILRFLKVYKKRLSAKTMKTSPALTITAREQFIPRTLARTVTGFLQPKDSYIAVVLTQRQRNESMERLGKGPLRWAAIRSSTISTSGLTAPGRTQSEQ